MTMTRKKEPMASWLQKAKRSVVLILPTGEYGFVVDYHATQDEPWFLVSDSLLFPERGQWFRQSELRFNKLLKAPKRIISELSEDEKVAFDLLLSDRDVQAATLAALLPDKERRMYVELLAEHMRVVDTPPGSKRMRRSRYYVL